MVKRIAYFVGDFPSKSQTWISQEIIQLMREGFIVRIFSIRCKKPSSFPNEYSVLVQNTEYRDNLFIIHFVKNISRNITTFYKTLKEIWTDFLNDTKGLRGKMQILKDLFLYICIYDRIKNFNPDIAIVHFANARANPVLYNNIIFKTPYIIKMHGTDVFQRPNLFNLKVKKAYKILIISNFNFNFIKNRDNDIDTSKFIIHHCGIDTITYKSKSLLERNNKLPVILSVARLTPMKGIDTLINASSILHNKGLEHKLIIAGYGTYKKFLNDLSNSLGIQNFVEFKDYCPPEEVKKLLYSSNLFVLASKIEGIPVSVMEAMSTGLPVITTKITGIPELIDNNINGFLVSPDDPIELSNKIEEILKMTKTELQEIANNARLKIETEFNMIKLTNELQNLFEQIN